MSKVIVDKYTVEAWKDTARNLFGDDPASWAFVCPVCGHVATVLDWKLAGAPEGAVAFSCVGRWTGEGGEMGDGKQPCNYSGGGLFRLNPVTVVDWDGQERGVFAFAPPQEEDHDGA